MAFQGYKVGLLKQHVALAIFPFLAIEYVDEILDLSFQDLNLTIADICDSL
jgi:hypothetical protein